VNPQKAVRRAALQSALTKTGVEQPATPDVR
jgi:hypothetical protein